MNEETNDLIELTGLWKQKSQAGKTYLSGNLGGARILIFANDRKEKDNQPDYRLFVAKRQRREEATSDGE